MTTTADDRVLFDVDRDTRIATIDQAGVVRGVRRGSTTVIATSEGKSGTATVRVE